MASADGSIKIKVDLDDSRAKRSLTDIGNQMSRLGKDTIPRFTSSGMKSFTKYESKLDGMKKSFNDFGKNSGNLFKNFNRNGSGFNNFFKSFKNNMNNLGRFVGRNAIAIGNSLGSVMRIPLNSVVSLSKSSANAVFNTLNGVKNSALSTMNTIKNIGVGTTVATVGAGLIGGGKRLADIDASRAKLEGMGYALKDVERISDDVKKAVSGTTITMAEGTNIAAGALAAGVKEGEDLQKYIKLVGSAAVSSGRDMNDMAQILNRVKSAGKLSRMELEMIEHGMPGFSNKLAKHLGVTTDEMYKLITKGEVTSDEFFKVMTKNVGKMQDAYANSFYGILSILKSRFNILGQTVLTDVFEPFKQDLAKLSDYLTTDELKAKLGDLGGHVLNLYTKIRDFLLRVFNSGIIGMIAGNVATLVSTVVGGLNQLFTWLAGNENIQNIFNNLTNTASRFIDLITSGLDSTVLDSIKVPLERLFEMIDKGINWLLNSGVISDFIGGVAEQLGYIADRLITMFSNVDGATLLEGVFNGILAAVEIIAPLLLDIVDSIFAWVSSVEGQEAIKNMFENMVGVVITLSEAVGWLIDVFTDLSPHTQGLILSFGAFFAIFQPLLPLLSGVVSILGGAVKFIPVITKSLFGLLGIIKGIIVTLAGIVGWPVLILGGLTVLFAFLYRNSEKFRNVVNGLAKNVKEFLDGFIEAVKELPGKIKDGFVNSYNAVVEFIGNVSKDFLEAGKNIVTSIADGIKSGIGKVTDAIGEVTGKIRDYLPFSPAKEGALRDIMYPGITNSIAKSIKNNDSKPLRAMRDLTDGIGEQLNRNFTLNSKIDDYNASLSGANGQLNTSRAGVILDTENSKQIYAKQLQDMNENLTAIKDKDQDVYMNNRKVTENINTQNQRNKTMNKYK